MAQQAGERVRVQGALGGTQVCSLPGGGGVPHKAGIKLSADSADSYPFLEPGSLFQVHWVLKELHSL